MHVISLKVQDLFAWKKTSRFCINNIQQLFPPNLVWVVAYAENQSDNERRYPLHEILMLKRGYVMRV